MASKEIPAGHVEVRWSYRPDDRSKQGTTEFLPKELARMKVGEGLATYVPVAPQPAGEEAGDASKPAKKIAASRTDS